MNHRLVTPEEKIQTRKKWGRHSNLKRRFKARCRQDKSLHSHFGNYVLVEGSTLFQEIVETGSLRLRGQLIRKLEMLAGSSYDPSKFPER